MPTMPSWPVVATVSQLRTAVKLEPRPEPEPDPARPEPQPSITKTTDEQFSCYRIKLSHLTPRRSTRRCSPIMMR